ncbi:NAD-dependent epimerase/dehydratase family protein [Methylocella sp. CPCC 101449]|uniref:NAD-dependent epimerase/dehydratase family protein n=1 Tax=Methylocella sp. CPCC 101449 TaxID=2987531 RepID=UPI0028918144|nr:NAD-dependent epimerase/dehydratase family protein [Methylocella sp. CPCC 101449]MDT2019667.1 GDP-mannose 4,6-dehydratase [Methylocella sp. CPCC 101449]
MKVFITGTAGFIGFHLARHLLDLGHQVDGYDGMTAYYDVRLKEKRHALLGTTNNFRAHIGMLEDEAALNAAAEAANPDVIVHLAAQAGVRYSIEHPRAYVNTNLVGTFNVMELTRRLAPKHFLFASTSSVYGANTVMPFVEQERTDHPLTLYAASKKAGEVMTHSYSHLWHIPTTAFRFFTVYGPWGRPDMALYKFVDAIENDRPIDIYNHGKMARDFTYVSDLVKAVALLIDRIPPAGGAADLTDDPSLSPAAPYRVVNIGRGAPVNLLDFVEEIERKLGKKAIRNYMDMQPGDVPATFASADLLERLTGYRPHTSVREGVSAFVDWYRAYRAEG